jgi:predicted ATPase
LCQRLGDTPDVSEVLWGLWTFYTLSAELGTARDIAEDFLRLAERLPYPGLAMRGHWAMEITFMHQGEFTLAMEHFQKAKSLYNPARHVDDAFLYALNPGVAMPCFAAWALWFLGQPDHALELMQETLTLAHASEPHSLAHALLFAAILHQLRREGPMAGEYADEAIAIANEHGLVMYQAMAMIIRGWVLIEQGGNETANEQIRQGITAQHATGANLMRPHFLALMAEGFKKTRQVKEGLRVLDEALEVAHRTGEGCYQAELFRMKGEMLLMQLTEAGLSPAAKVGKPTIDAERPAVALAQSCFDQAIEIARRQNAKSWELRSAMSLSRLYQHQGKEQEALDLLTHVYGSFTEGFDTVDLREARALIDELSSI